ncbi:pyridoxine 5'-phosphate synthase [Alkaliflexus imshenetskii]|uniref:pyridoxine 5'-phosphate synthase n=1 Tax=Alkaliflexus imshenetskii TaxID=286730 RepID=UPI00047DBE79|nr:pyridoxine 5'-phosphate synthase [Alkaliflexus imshenetskii]
MTKLSVNINKIATLRNSRGGNIPDVVKAAVDVQLFGADGVTVHPRPDERHIRRKDVFDIRGVITTEFNIEGYPSPEFIQLVKNVKPHQVTLVPDPPEAITSNAGWDTITNLSFLKDVIAEFKEYGIRTSIFIDTTPEFIANAVETGTDRVELYTEPYATGFVKDPEMAIAPFVEAANLAHKAGLKINAGHDLNLQNLKFFNERIPFLKEVSIGHALIADALYIGLEKTISMYKNQLVKG